MLQLISGVIAFKRDRLMVVVNWELIALLWFPVGNVIVYLGKLRSKMLRFRSVIEVMKISFVLITTYKEQRKSTGVYLGSTAGVSHGKKLVLTDKTWGASRN